MNDDIKQKYSNIGGLLDDALNSTSSIVLEGEDENKELAAIKAALEDINASFKTEIDNLESSSEWDKFCIAYFGETNAGKSTIIESLRIIYNEESRWLERDAQDKEYKTMLSKHSEEYSNLLKELRDVNAFLHEPARNKMKKSVVVGIVFLLLIFLAVGIIIGIIFF